MTGIGILAAAFAFGIASAMVPVLNAEAYVALNVAVLGTPVVVGLVVAFSAGTAIGKVVLFQGARAGRRVVVAKRRPSDKPVARWRARLDQVTAWLLSFLDRPYKGPPTVLLSAAVGLPPLLAVALIAGVSKQNVWLFAAAVFVGRAARFAVLALTVAEVF